jgi:hypothetical protein
MQATCRGSLSPLLVEAPSRGFLRGTLLVLAFSSWGSLRETSTVRGGTRGRRGQEDGAMIPQEEMKNVISVDGSLQPLCATWAYDGVCPNQPCPFSHATKDNRFCLAYFKKVVQGAGAECNRGEACFFGHSPLSRNRFNAYLANRAARMAADDGQRQAAQVQAPAPMQGGNMHTQESHNALAENASLNAKAEPQSSLSFHTCSGSELPNEEEITSERTTQFWPLVLDTVPAAAGTIQSPLLQRAFLVFYSPPYELAAQVSLDLYTNPPKTSHSSRTLTFEEIGMHPDNADHSFFLQCYAQIPAEKGFCADGVFKPPSSYASLTDTGSQTPRYSVLKNMPASHLKAFLTQTRDGHPLVSSVKNRDLTIQNGLKETSLPKALTDLVNSMQANMYVNNDVSTLQQAATFLQHGLKDLNEALLNYYSPIYEHPILLPQKTKKCMRAVINRDHPLYDKWLNLLSRIFSAESGYCTTRLMFPWRGFYLPNKTNGNDKYAWCSFVMCMDLFLGPIPGYPDIDTYSLYQLDRVNSNRHYTIDNVRWMDKANNIANKPAGVDDGSHTQKQRKAQRKARAVEKSTELDKTAYESPYKVSRSVEARNLKSKTESYLTYAGGEGWTQGKTKNEKD